MFVVIPGFSRYYIDHKGNIMSLARNKVKDMKPALSPNGYHFVQMFDDSGKLRRVSVHRMMMSAWVGPSDMHVDHKNCNKLDNSIENLEYVTHVENKRRAKLSGKVAAEETHGMRKLSSEDALSIRKLKDSGLTLQQVGDRFNISKHTVCLIWKGKIWKTTLSLAGYEVSTTIKKNTYVKNGKAYGGY